MPIKFDPVEGPTKEQACRIIFCLALRDEVQKEIDEFKSAMKDLHSKSVVTKTNNSMQDRRSSDGSTP